VKKAVDQCAEVGFEMIIMSFGSGLNMESKDPAYIKEVSRHAVSRAPAQFLEATQAYESYMFFFISQSLKYSEPNFFSTTARQTV
jgi:hypothetical protein